MMSPESRLGFYFGTHPAEAEAFGLGGINGFINTINPVNWVKGIWNTVAHPVKTISGISDSVTNTLNTIKNGSSVEQFGLLGNFIGAEIGGIVLGEAASIVKDVTKSSGIISNSYYIESRGGVINQLTVTEDTVFYRVYSGKGKTGKWLTAVPPSSRKLALEGLSLPKSNKANRLQKVTVPAGTVLERSRAAPIPEWRRYRGGMEQFELKTIIDETCFGPGEVFK